MRSLRDRRAALVRVLLPVAGAAVAIALALTTLVAQRSHRAAAERVLRDYAGVAGTEFVRRTAFDVGFNGYQLVAAALARTDARGALALPARLSAEARRLVAQLFLVEGGAARLVAGDAPPAWLEAWIGEELARPLAAHAVFVARHRVIDGQAATLILVPLDERGARWAAFNVDLTALRPFLMRSLERGPLLPEVIGDGKVGNGALSVSFEDRAGLDRLQAGDEPRPAWEVAVPFGDFYLGVLAGCRVRVSIDPAIAGRVLPGGLPGSQLPLLGALVLLACALALLAVRQDRRERAFTRLREDFVASVSHELRTPLAQIRLFVETVLLDRCRSREETRRFLTAAAREAVRLGNLVGNILDFSRAERGVLDVERSPRRLAPLVEQVTQAFAPLAAARRVTLESRLDPGAGAAVDEAGFTRLLLNLLDNAVKYGPEQGDVTVRLERAAAGVELAVEDRGPGIPAGEREHIFAPFQRLERDRRSAATGAGIGLAIVREQAARHGGSCRVEDREGGGARFVVRLPGVEVPA